MTPSLEGFDLGRHEEAIRSLGERVDGLDGTIRNMDAKLDKIIVSMAEKRGERRAIAAIATAAGGLGSFGMTMLIKLLEHTR